jgi:hypothetical protein
MSNLRFYETFRVVPDTAKKEIKGGRLNGKTDINPMWRIKALTEAFGPVGIGWKYDIIKQWTELGANDEVAAFCNIELRYKDGDKWSEPIPGTGGSMFVANEKSGKYVNDECYKMALTDALSVACKALGVGADVYWDKDSTKYNKPQEAAGASKTQRQEPEYFVCRDCGEVIKPFKASSGKTYGVRELAARSEKKYGRPLCVACAEKVADESTDN